MTVFVLRCWLEPQMGGRDEWRASVYDPRNQQRRYFTDPSDLSEFLTDLEPSDSTTAQPAQRSNP